MASPRRGVRLSDIRRKNIEADWKELGGFRNEESSAQRIFVPGLQWIAIMRLREGDVPGQLSSTRLPFHLSP